LGQRGNPGTVYAHHRSYSTVQYSPRNERTSNKMKDVNISCRNYISLRHEVSQRDELKDLSILKEILALSKHN